MTTTALQTADMFLPVGNLDVYIQRINQFALLTEEEEHDLATQFSQHQDLEAARKLVLSHLRFVVKVARGYMGYGLALGDLIQEGNVGLMKAVKKFDPEKGVRLVTFAIHWIKAEIHEFILKNWRIVKIATTKAQRKLFFNLRSMKKQLGWMSKNEVEDVAETLNVDSKTVLEMESRLHSRDAAFDGYSDDENNYLAPAHTLGDCTIDPARLIESDDWAHDGKIRLYDAFEKLDARSQTILQKRWLTDQKTTLQDLAKEFNVSAERIRQLEEQAIQQLKSLMLKSA